METETIFDIDHPLLGTVRGLTSYSTNRFLNVRFATLKDRFSPAELKGGNADGIISAIELGPTVISPPMGLDLEFSHIQKSLPKPTLPQSELECLNLNITTPKGASTASKLPVIVFFHGGGFGIGSNAWPQYDFRRIIQLSRRLGQPVIGVNINYRLGVFGFLTSKELVQNGYQPNNGLRDQRIALLWVQKYIAGFGGDPENVTVVGESAGGVSVITHLQSNVALFRRLVSMGGTNLLMKPLPESVTEATYQTVLKKLGLQNLSPSNQVKALLELDAQNISSSVSPGTPLLPSLDGQMVIKEGRIAEIYQGCSCTVDLPGRNWCNEIMIGDCQMDASILSLMIQRSRTGIAEAFKESIAKSLDSSELANEVLTAYEIGEDISDDEAFQRILYFGNDINFLLPTVSYASYWSGSAYIYHFNEPNPWDGPWKGYASHILDVAFLFQNYNEHLSELQRGTAIKFAEDLLNFANGEAAWPAFTWETGDLFARVYGSSVSEVKERVETVKVPSSRAERRETIFKLTSKIPSDDLSNAWAAFMAGF